MPKVAQYEPNQVQSQVASQPLAKDAPAAAFGAPLAKGVMDVAQAGFELKQRVDTTSSEEALVNFERDKNDLFFNPESGYFNTVGRNAYDNSVTANKALDDLKLKYGEGLNIQAKQMFDKSADVHITRGQVDITKHSAKGLKTWEVATLESQVENTIENSSLYWNDPDRLRVQNILGRQAVIDSADMMGVGAEAKAEKLQTFDSSFARASIEAAIQSSSVDGKEAMSSYGAKLEGPDKVKLDGMIEKKALVEKTKADSEQAVLTANRLVDTHDNRSDIMEEVSKIKDPALQKKTRTEVTAQYNQKRNAEKEKQNSDYNDAIAEVNKGATPTQVQSLNSEAWEGMSQLQQNNILSGKHTVTDQRLFTRLRLLPTAEKAKLNPTDYSAQLRPSDLQKLTTEVNAAKKGKPGSRVKSLSSKSMQAAEGAFGKKAKWSRKSGGMTVKGQAANQFLTDLQDAVDDFEESKGGALITPAEEDKIIGEFTRQITVERSAFGFDILATDTEIDLSNAPANDVRMLNQIIDSTPNIDMVDLTDAYQFLIDNDQPINAQTLKNAYSQGTK